MTIKTEKATWLPPVEDGTSKPTHGWLSIDRKIWQITNWHSFADFGATLETLTIERGNHVMACRMETGRPVRYETKEIYSYDEGETFTFDIE